MDIFTWINSSIALQLLMLALLTEASFEKQEQTTQYNYDSSNHRSRDQAFGGVSEERIVKRLLRNRNSSDSVNITTDSPSILRSLWEDKTRGSILSALVKFMLSKSMGQHFYFLHDHVTDGMADALVRQFENRGDLTIFEDDLELFELEKSIRAHYHVDQLRNVFVICSPQNTANIFQKITARKLETPSIYWYVILEDDITMEIANTIREGTQMSVALKTKNKYEFLVSYINKEDEVAFENVGWWMWTTSVGFLKQPIFRPLMEVYSDFGGRVMRSAVVDNSPFFKVTFLDDGSIAPHSGIDFHVLNALAKKLNFTYQLVLTEDGQWGGEQPDGSFSGMIGKVVRHEAHFAINEITITENRERVVDFTFPYFLESTALISSAPVEKNRAFAVFSPFTSEVWLLIGAATLLMGPVIALAARLRLSYVGLNNDDCHSLTTFSFNVFRTLVVQGNRLQSKCLIHRFLQFGWFFFCFLIYALYAGTLTAVLAVPAFEKPIDSLWELLTAVKEDHYKPVVVFGTSNEFIFKLATGGIYKQLWDVFDASEGYVDTWDAGIEKVLTGKFVFLNAQLGAEIRAKRRGLHKYYFARSTFYPQGYSIACSNGSPYKALFEKLLIQLGSAGLVQKWTKDEVAKVKSAEMEESKGPGAITLVHLQAAFFIIVIGYTVAIGALIAEWVSFNYCTPKNSSTKPVLGSGIYRKAKFVSMVKYGGQPETIDSINEQCKAD